MIGWIFGIGAGCMVLERVKPGWRLPQVRTWPARVVAVNLAQLAVVLLAGITWEAWLHGWSLLKLWPALPAWPGGILAYVIGTFVFYWWHRWRHESDVLWRLFHQIHHSPQRIELITSFYKHPLEMAVNSIIGSVLCYALLGLDLEGGAVFTLCCALGEFFYHTSVRTPRWIGYFFQRPEMHRIHHQHNRHRNNYGDIPLWDMLFGTYENPAEFTDRCGFDPAREERLGAMLKWVDVHAESKQ